jgi:hypothetical protein
LPNVSERVILGLDLELEDDLARDRSSLLGGVRWTRDVDEPGLLPDVAVEVMLVRVHVAKLQVISEKPVLFHVLGLRPG